MVHGTIPFSNRAISDLEIAAASPRMAPSRVLSRFRGGKRLFEVLESTHLIYRLPPLGYGKEVLRGRFKIYLADAAIAPAVLLKGKAILEDTTALGVATETAVFKHLFARYHAQIARFSYWRGKKDQEVDLVAEVEGELIPLEVKYRAQHAGTWDLKGLLELCESRRIKRGYVVTKTRRGG